MTITATDIKLLASERMTDTTDGGGRRTSNVIADGVAGNIFPKVSRLDSVYGRVNLRKVFGAVQTPTLDTYAGAHAVIMQPPSNLNIIASLFSTGSDFDTRTEARDRIESYVVAGPESRMTLLGRQLVGQGAITTFQRVEEPLPDVGDVFCLSNEVAGVTNYQQYVRLTDVTHEIRTFTDTQGDFTRRVVTLKISSPLRFDFSGSSVDRVTNAVTGTGKTNLVRTTTVADAARYYGIQPLVVAANQNDLSVKVQSVYASIVPTTQREAPVSNAQISGASHIEPAATGTTTRTYPPVLLAIGVSTGIRLPGAAVPGSVTLSVTSGHGFQGAYGDSGAGTLNLTSGNLIGIQNTLQVDYEAGVITFVNRTGSSDTWTFTVTHTPAAIVSQVAHTRGIDITLGTRGTVYVETLSPLPSPGTLVVDYRALGKWYRLRDDGTGALIGDDQAFGTGTVDYSTGALVVTLGALPDVGSMIMLAWGSPAHYLIRAGATHDTGGVVRQKFLLNQLPVNEASATFAYIAGGVTYTGVANALGVVSGGGLTGSVNHVTGEVNLQYTTRLPDFGTTLTATYQQKQPTGASPTTVTGTINVVDPLSIDLGTPVAAKGLTLQAQIGMPAGLVYTTALTDDGSGNVITFDSIVYSSGGAAVNILKVIGGQVVGTINYATGHVSLTAIPSLSANVWASNAWITVSGAADRYVISPWTFSVSTGAASSTSAFTQNIDPINAVANAMYVDLTTTTINGLVPGSVVFTLAGQRYFERNGVLYSSLNVDGSAQSSGTIDYDRGEAHITLWTGNTALALAVQGCLTVYGVYTTHAAWFRSAGSPLRVESVFVQVTDIDGNSITATSDANGNVVSASARGTVNNEMGVINIEWGTMVTAAGNETQPWYDPANVVGTQVFKPIEVYPGTLLYNSVVLTNLPLNADILGLDPVRLPSDGRVPIYRAADVAVIHNTQTVALPNPPVAGATYAMGRGDLSDLWIVDANGARVDTTTYVVDLVAGSVTMAANLNLVGAVLPWSAKHRIEQVLMLSDVQINGELSVAAPISRAFGTDSYVSSALLFGDMFARVTNVFDQTTFTGVWSDTRIGNDSAATFDTINFPIIVQNDGAITERWRINFTTATAFQVIGEDLGVIATGTTTADLQPVNPLTGKPYFTLHLGGWGGGWSAGVQLRFNTVGATAPIWIARTVLPGATLNGDSLDMQLRGDVDA